MRPARLLDGSARRWGPASGILLGLGLLVAGVGPAPAEPHVVTSNTKLLLEGTVRDNQNGEDVAVIGLMHVQTKLYPALGLVAVHANLTEAVLAYGVNDPTPDDPTRERLNSLSQAAKELRARINVLFSEIRALQHELQEVLSHDLNPFLPGIQYDEERAAALRRRLAELSAEMKRLQKELAGVQNEIADLLLSLKENLSNVLERLVGFKGHRGDPSDCSPSGVCERVVSMDMVRSDGGRTHFDVLLRLQLSDLGLIVSGEASVEEDDSGDDDLPPCP